MVPIYLCACGVGVIGVAPLAWYIVGGWRWGADPIEVRAECDRIDFAVFWFFVWWLGWDFAERTQLGDVSSKFFRILSGRGRDGLFRFCAGNLIRVDGLGGVLRNKAKWAADKS